MRERVSTGIKAVVIRKKFEHLLLENETVLAAGETKTITLDVKGNNNERQQLSTNGFDRFFIAMKSTTYGAASFNATVSYMREGLKVASDDTIATATLTAGATTWSITEIEPSGEDNLTLAEYIELSLPFPSAAGDYTVEVRLIKISSGGGSATVAVDTSGNATTLFVTDSGELINVGSDTVAGNQKTVEQNPINMKNPIDKNIINESNTTATTTYDFAMNGYSSCSMQFVVGGGTCTLTVLASLDDVNFSDVTLSVFSVASLTATGELIDDAGKLGHYKTVRYSLTTVGGTCTGSVKRKALR